MPLEQQMPSRQSQSADITTITAEAAASSSSSSSSQSQSSLLPPHQVLQIQRMKVKSSTTTNTKRNSNSTKTTTTTTTTTANNEPVPKPLVMVGMLFIGLLVALLVMAFFAIAPLLCASWLGIVYVVGLYLSTESNWWWHDAQEFENRFWTFTAFMFSAALLYIKDSPFAVGRWNATLGMVLVIVFTTGVHFLDRFIHRREISRKPRLNQACLSFDSVYPSTFSQNLFKYKATAEEKALLLTESVGRIDRIYLPSTINNMINLSEVRRHEQKIFRILAGASKDELNFILNNVRLALLFYKVKDHSKLLRSDQSRTNLVDLLCTTRLADLTVTSRAILLDALMVMKLSAHPMSEKWVRNLVLKTSGDDLSNLKTYTDAKGDFHSMHKLVFSDIRDVSIRNDILNHIKREAGVQTAHMRLGTKRARNRRQQAWRKVLSDVDDTLYSSGGRYPAGLDTRFPRHTIYPGVLSFYRELDMGTAGPDDWTDDRVGNLVFLSARPHVYKDMSEKKSYAKFAALYEKKGMHTMPSMLAGNLTSGRAFMVLGDLEPMARKKFDNFCEFYQLYPEFTHVFVGDNGQADIRAAELIHARFGPDVLEAGFFQLVQPIEQTFGYRDKSDIARWKAMNIVFFHTYVGAAVEAFAMRKLRLVGLSKICAEAVVTFNEIHTWPTPADRERARLLMNNDLVRANALLSAGQLAPIDLLPKPQVFALNSQVRTPFGRAIVRKFRAVEGIYAIDLVDWTTQQRKRVRAFVPEESLVAYVSGSDVAATSSAAASASALQLPATAAAAYISFHRAPLAPVLAPQTLVKTPFGNGRVLRYRRDDAIYMVALAARAPLTLTGYFAADAVIPLLASDGTAVDASPRMFSGVRSGLGYITKKLTTFVVPSGSGATNDTKPLFALGSTLETPFGRAVVLRFRALDRVYELQLVKSQVAIGGVFVHEQCLTESAVAPPRSWFAMLGIRSGKSVSAGPTTGSTTPSSVPLLLQDAAEPVAGANVVTPYGNGVVRCVRPSDGVLEVELRDWKLAHGAAATAFLTASAVRNVRLASSSDSVASPPSSGKGLFQLLRYGFSSSSSSAVEPQQLPMSEPPLSYAAVDGVHRRLTTVFGEATTSMPTPFNGVYKAVMANPDLCGAVAFVQATDVADVVAPTHARKNTLELFGNPFSYLRWSSSNVDEHGNQATSALFQPPPTAAATTPQQEFACGALVVSRFGEGVVERFRPTDAIYEVALLHGMRGYFTPSSLDRPVRGVVGQPVDTRFGSGLLTAVRDRDGVHVVTLRHALLAADAVAITAFLQPSSVTGPLRAARGDVVQTPFGKGVVLFYRAHDAFYCVALEWGERAASSRRNHVTAYLRECDIVRTNAVEKNPSGCAVM